MSPRTNLAKKAALSLLRDPSGAANAACTQRSTASIIARMLAIGFIGLVVVNFLYDSIVPAYNYDYIEGQRVPVLDIRKPTHARVLDETVRVLRDMLASGPRDVMCASCPCAGISMRCIVWKPEASAEEVWVNPVIVSKSQDSFQAHASEPACLWMQPEKREGSAAAAAAAAVIYPQKLYVKHGPPHDRHVAIIQGDASACALRSMQLFDPEEGRD